MQALGVARADTAGIAATAGGLSFRLRGVDGRHPYLASRGIAEATAAVFGIGFYPGPGC
jgi:hypothetical protein